jgi:alkanesulfonate monooxygenase SsuD/methylene tetrahydromethanopterin reductase-like flavin-dependent oxidoreductase (luciferase family)
MTGCIVATDLRELERRARRVMDLENADGSVGDWIEGRRGQWVIGTVAEVVDDLATLREAGVERVMLQHLAHDDVEMVHLIGAEVARQLPHY